MRTPKGPQANTENDQRRDPVTPERAADGLARQALLDGIKQGIDAALQNLSDEEAKAILDGSSCRNPVSLASDTTAHIKTPTLKDVLRVRNHRALHRLVDALPVMSLFRAISAPTDLEALILTIQDGSVELPPVQENPLAGAMALAVLHKQELLRKAGPMLAVADVQRILGISRQAVDKRRDRGGLLAVKVGKVWLYPQLQFDLNAGGTVDPAILKVLHLHQGDNPWGVLDALLARDPALEGQTLMEAIHSGRDDLIDLYARQLQGNGFV